jgi:hypothetical protein
VSRETVDAAPLARDEDAEASRVWTVALLGCALAVGVQAGFASLSDPDLPNHLSLGEWIIAHRAVPFTEPFAWTRAGSPFFAYSWLAQIVLFTVLRFAGPVGLHLLAATIGVGVTLASAACARALGARGAGPTFYAVASALVAFETTPFLRPQLMMFVLVPLAWVCVARLRSERYENRASLIALLVLNAVAAGVHISFPAMAAPLVLVALDRRAPRLRGAWLTVVVIVLGWLISPYALVWPDVFRLNFAPNAITNPPAPTGELTPGFLVSPLVGVVLAALPLFAMRTLRDGRERVLYGAMWLLGLVVFARMFKGLGPWWWVATPLAIAALELLPRATSGRVRRIYAVALVAFVGALAIANVRLYSLLAPLEGGVPRRTLPSMKAFAAEPAARWLEQNSRAGGSGRLLTAFNYGSYLKWRLPWLSESIDGRTIFPDSAALPDAIAERGVAYEGPWRSADVAIVPVTYPVAARLDQDAGWVRIGEAPPAPWATDAPHAGLWVRRSWWSRWGATSTLPPGGKL